MLRIVAGELGGRRLRAPGGRDVRPTRESVREAWFNALAGRVAGARVVDLFAGSGALGLEALSRGAEEVHFVEADRRVVDVLRRNVEELGVGDRSRTFRRDVRTFLDDLSRRGEEPYDVGLADPPYGSGEAERLVAAWAERPFARLLCVEHGAEAVFEDASAVWHRGYGDTGLSFFASPGEPSDDAGSPIDVAGGAADGGPAAPDGAQDPA